jgi:hypothetical protein
MLTPQPPPRPAAAYYSATTGHTYYWSNSLNYGTESISELCGELTSVNSRTWVKNSFTMVYYDSQAEQTEVETYFFTTANVNPNRNAFLG